MAAGLLGAFFGIYDVEFFIRPIPQEWNIQSEEFLETHKKSSRS